MVLQVDVVFHMRRRNPVTQPQERELIALNDSSSASAQEPLSLERAIQLVREGPVEAIKAMGVFNRLLSSSDKLSQEDHVKALMGRTEVLYVQKNFLSAREDVLRALEILRKPDCQLIAVPWKIAESHRYLARIYVAEDKVDEARSQFEMGYGLYKTHEELAKEYISFERQQNNIQKALQICDAMIQAIPNPWDFFYQRAKIHFAARKWPQAHQDCTVFLQNKESQIGYRKEVFDLGAKTCLEMKNYSQASNFMEQAWLLESTPPRAVVRSREVLDTRLLSCMEEPLKMGGNKWEAIEKSPEVALGVFDELLKVDREPAELMDLLLGRAIACIALKREENYPSARQNLERVRARIDSADIMAKVRLFRSFVQLCLQEGKTDEALSHFQAWYAFDRSDCPPVYLQFLQNVRKAPQEVCQFCCEILKSHPSEALYYRANAYFALERWADARQDCEDLLKLNIKSFFRLRTLDLCAKACLKLEDYGAVYRWLQEAYKLDVSSAVLNRFTKLQEVYGVCRSQQGFTLGAPEEDLLHLVNCGNQNQDPKDAVKIFDHVLQFRDKLSSGDLCRTLHARAVHCVNTQEASYLVSARQNLNEAFQLLPGNLHPSEVLKLRRSLLLCLAHVDIREKKPEEALKRFEEAWKISRTPEILGAYRSFLQSRGDHAAAIQLCSVAKSSAENDDFYPDYLEMMTYIEAEEWGLAFESFQFLMTSSFKETGMAALHYHGSQIYLHMGGYQTAIMHARKACSFDEVGDPPHFMERMENLLRIKKVSVIDEHLKKLPAPRESAHATALLKTYEKELPDFPKHHVRLLTLRAELFLREKKWDEAYEDDAKIVRVLKDGSDLFSKGELEQMEAGSKGRARQCFEGFLARAPNPYTFVNGEDYERVLQLFNDHPKLFSKKDRARVDALVEAAKKAEAKRVAAEKKSSS